MYYGRYFTDGKDIKISNDELYFDEVLDTHSKFIMNDFNKIKS